MTEKTVAVRLIAITAAYQAKLSQAAASTKAFGASVTETSKKNTAGMQAIGIGAVAVGASMLYGFGKAVGAAADFDHAMSGVGAAAQASAKDMNLLRESALQAGADTAFSATQAAAGQEALVKAGVSVRDVLGGGLTGALDLAAAGNLAVGESAEIAATAMTQFNLAGKDVPHIADLLAAGAGKAQGEVHDLGMALNQSALVARQTGLTIEETTAGLASFASAGLIGSDAGTSFKTMLLRLTPTSKEAAGMMNKLGISAYDSQGQFIGLSKFAENLRVSLKDLTPEQRNAALATMFGSDAIRAANVLYQQGGAGIENWTQLVNDQGFASEQAAKRLDNLRGDLEKLSGSIETALIESGTSANVVLREMVQVATGVVNVYNDLPPIFQAAATALAAFGGSGLVVAGGLLVLLPKIVAARAAMSALGLSVSGLGMSVGRALPWLAVAGMALEDLTSDLDEVGEGVEVAGVKMTSFRESMGLAGREASAAAESTGELADSLRGHLNVGLNNTQDALDGVLGAWHRQTKAIAKARSGYTAFAGMSRKEFRTWRGDTVEGLDVVSNALSDLAGDAHVTAKEWERAFKRQVNALVNYTANLNTVERRNIPDALLQQIVSMGTEGAGILEFLAESSKQEFKKYVGQARGAERKTKDLSTAIGNLPDPKVDSSDLKGARNDADAFLKKLIAIRNIAKLKVEASFNVPQGAGFAVGGTPTAMAHQVMGAVPGFQAITSGYRPGDPGFHGVSPPWNAVDIGGTNLPAVYATAKALGGASIREMIYGHNIYEHGVERYYSPTDHFDHVHLAEHGYHGTTYRPTLFVTSERYQKERVDITPGGGPTSSYSGPMELVGVLELRNGKAWVRGTIREVLREP